MLAFEHLHPVTEKNLGRLDTDEYNDGISTTVNSISGIDFLSQNLTLFRYKISDDVDDV